MSEKYIYIVLGGLLLFLVVTPLFYWLRGKRRPTKREWQLLRGRIREMTRANLDDRVFSEPTRSALNLLLTDRPGYANKNNLPFALQILEESGSHTAASIRSLSTISVFIGLVATAYVFATVLGDLGPLLEKQGDSTGRDLTKVLDYLQIVYMVNGFAIFLGLVVFAVSRFVEDYSHDVVRLATGIISQLPDHEESAVDPQLLSALRAVTLQIHNQFREGMGEWQERHLGDIRAIVAEVKGLADGIAHSVQVLQARSATDTGSVLAAIRETQASVESSAIRLDRGVGRLLADGEPALKALVASAESLKESSEKLQNSGTLEAVASIGESADVLKHLVTALPTTMESALRATSERLEAAGIGHMKAAGEQIASSIAIAAEQIDVAFSEGMAGVREGVVSATSASMERHQAKTDRAIEALTASVRSLESGSRALENFASQFGITVEKLETTVDRVSSRRWPW